MVGRPVTAKVIENVELYKDVAAEFAVGGAAAFMKFLAELDLQDFGEHTKPILTQAKKELIEIGMPSAQLFWQEIKDELLPFPYTPALADDVYRAYTIWCSRRGHKMPQAQNVFTPAFIKMNGVHRITPNVPDPDKAHEGALPVDKQRRRRVFLMGSRPEDKDERTWMIDGTRSFRRALKEFMAEGGSDFSDGSAPARGMRGDAF